MGLAPNQDSYVIGREDPASSSYPDIDLVPFGGEEGGVSRRHAQITRRDDQYFIEDLNSVNYTFVNKRKIAVGVAQPLRDGDEIRLGRSADALPGELDQHWRRWNPSIVLTAIPIAPARGCVLFAGR